MSRTTPPKPQPTPRNGVDTPALFAAINAVKQQTELARFTFRASSRWVAGAHTATRVEPFSGAGDTHRHKRDFRFDTDHPEVLAGDGMGPTPVELLLHGLAGCLTAGIANIASARGVELESVESTVEGTADLQGILGLSDEIRNGYDAIRVTLHVKGNGPEEKLRQIVEQARRRSAVYDVLANGTAIEIDVETK